MLLPVLALLLLPANPGQGPIDASADVVDGTVLTRLDWPSLVARDARISFTPRSGRDAMRELEDHADERPDLSTAERAVALLALGLSGATDSQSLLSSWASAGTILERQASMFALGESRQASADDYDRWLRDPLYEIQRAGMFACLLDGRSSARTRVVEIAGDEAHAQREAAARLLAFDEERATSQRTEAAEVYLELRWEAARRFGLVDGQAWTSLILDRLIRDDEFLDQVILPSAAKLVQPGIEDHLLHLLTTGSGSARIAAAVEAMPKKVARLISNDLWTPGSTEEWEALLDAIWDGEHERLTKVVLVRALDVPATRHKAAAAIARSGDLETAEVLAPTILALDGVTRRQRVWAAEFAVHLGDEDAVEALARLREDESPEVRAAALVGLLRSRREEPLETLREILLTPGHEERKVTLEALCAQVRSSRVSSFLDEFLTYEETSVQERIRARASLILGGRATRPGTFSEDIRKLPLRGELGALTLRACARRALTEDLDFLRRHFPVENDREVNLAAARGLLDRGEAGSLPIVRATMWRGPWDRSILAAALLIDLAGFRALHDELERPPAAATSKDLRRVGFALGEWGRMTEVDALSRRLRTGTGDPILQGAVLGALTARTQ